MGLNIAITGYFGVGSSAVWDYLCEYECNGTGIKNKGGYEHTTLYHPGGLFDLEDKLLLGNDAYRSDEALKTFEKEMMRLSNNNFGWFGSFEQLFGNKFKDILHDFIQELHPVELNSRYYGQYKKVVFNPLKLPVQLLARLLAGRTIYVWGRQFLYDSLKPQIRVAMPSQEEFYIAARKFVKDYMNLYKEPDKENTLFDRLLHCHNAYRLPRYFDQNFRLIIVQRDVRDIYCLNKYIWPEMNAESMYPKEIEEFIIYWKRMHSCETEIDDDRILNVYFEDLVYCYDETTKKIEQHCQLCPEQHNKPKEYFQPERSRNNTQVFRLKELWKDEIKRLEDELPEYCYKFPCINEADTKEMFDDSRTDVKRGIIHRLKQK